MRRLLVTGLFGYGIYWLWNSTDSTENYIAIGMMGLAVLVEFASG